MTDSLAPAYFDALYAADPDPWRFQTSAYEAEKYARTLAALGERHFASALEVGCSIGVLTAQLAGRCDALLSVDVAEAALAQARTRCAGLAQVRFANRAVPAGWPEGSYDLILFSEVLYYLAPDDIARTAAAALGSLRPGGVVLLVHFTDPTNYPVSGDEAVRLFEQAAGAGLAAVRRERPPRYRLDRLDRPA